MKNKMEFRLVAYDRLGARRGIVPNPLETMVNKAWNGLSTLDLHYDRMSPNHTYLDDEPEIGFEYLDENGVWKESFDARFRCMSVDFDHLDEVPTRKYQFIGIGEGLKGALVYSAYALPLNDEGKVQFKNTNAGKLVATVWDNAVSRGWTGFSRSFTSTHDSAGQPWSQTFSISYSIDTHLLSIVNALIAQGLFDMRWEGRTLHMYKKGTITPNRSSGPWPVRFAGNSQYMDGVDAAPEQNDLSSLATHVIILGENNLRWEFPTGAVVPEGRREVIESYSGVDDIATAQILAAPIILKSQNHLKNTTRQFHLTDEVDIRPLINYDIGAWVDVQRGTTFENLQIIALNIQINENGTQGYVTLGDKIDDLLTRMYERIQGLTGGIKNEGGKPPVPSVRTPSAPSGVNASADASINSVGQTIGSLTVNWAHNGKDTLNQVIEIKHYNVYYRAKGTTPWIFLFRSTEQSGVGSPVPVYKKGTLTLETYEVAVDAISTQDKRSALSFPLYEVTMNPDVTPPPKPTDPVVTTWLRTVGVFWDGMGLSESNAVLTMPRDFDYVKVLEANNALMTGATEVGRLVKGSSLQVGSKPADTTIWYALIAVDRSGNESPMSAIKSVTPRANVSASEIINAIDASNVMLTNVGSVSLLPEAVTADKLALDAVTKEKLADDVTIEMQQALDDAEQARLDALAAQTDATNALANAAAADLLADSALAKALESTGVAQGKGQVWPQTSPPPVGAYHRWSGTAHRSNSERVAVGGAVERTNYAQNPSAGVDTWGWAGSSANITLSRDMSTHHSGPASFRGALVAAASTGDINNYASKVAVTAGQVWTLSPWLRTSIAVNLKLTVEYRNASDVLVSTSVKVVKMAADTWTRHSITVTVPTNATHMFIRVGVNDARAAAFEWWVDDLLIERVTTAKDYFDGTFLDDRANDLWIDLDDGNKGYRWDSTTHAWVVAQDAGIQYASDQAGQAISDAAAADAKAVQAQTDATAAANAAAAADAKAVTAKNTADQAVLDAAAAQTSADNARAIADAATTSAQNAQQTADRKITISADAPTTADGTGKPVPAMWQRKVDGKVVGVWNWDGTSWLSMPLSETWLPQVNIGTGTYGELDGLRIKARTVGTTQLIVSDLNSYIENGTFEYPLNADGTISGWTRTGNWTTSNTDTAPEGTFCAKTQYNGAVQTLINNYPVYLKAGDQVRVRLMVNASAVGSGDQLRIGLYNVVGGTIEGQVNPFYGATWSEENYVFTATTEGWKKLYLATAGSAGAGSIKVDNVRMWRMNGGELIVDGSLKAIHIDTNNLTSDTAFIGHIKTKVIVSDVFEGKTFTGGTFTGSTFQTEAASLRGVKLTPSGITSYDNTGATLFSLSASTGKAILIGRVRTGANNEAGTTLLPAPESSDGLTSGMFITPTSTLSGTTSAGCFLYNAVNSTSPQNLYLRGSNEGHVEIDTGHLYIRGLLSGGVGTRIGNFSSWALGNSPTNGQNYLPNLLISPSSGTGYLKLANAPTSSSAANGIIAVSPEGVMYRSTSSLKYKADVQDWDPALRSLNLRPRSWVDRKPMDPAEPMRRYVGYIAEEVHQILPELVTYNEFGEPESIMYDRMPSPGTIVILKEIIRRLKEKGIWT